jgi:hypothetical protein
VTVVWEKNEATVVQQEPIIIATANFPHYDLHITQYRHDISQFHAFN